MNSTALTHEEISRRARELWLASGSPADRDLEFWLLAERALVDERARHTHRALSAAARRGKLAADEIDEAELAGRLDDFGDAGRRSVTSAEPQS